MKERGLEELRRKVSASKTDDKSLFVDQEAESRVLILALRTAVNAGRRVVSWRVTSASPTPSGTSVQARIRINGVIRTVTFSRFAVEDVAVRGDVLDRVEEICREGLFEFADLEFRSALRVNLRWRRSKRELDALTRDILIHASCVLVPHTDRELLGLRDEILAAALEAAKRVTPQQMEAAVVRQAKKKAVRAFRAAAYEACKSLLTDEELRRILDEERVKSVLE